MLHEQEYKFVDFLYTDMENFHEYLDYHLVLSRRLDAFIWPFSK